MLKWLAGLFLLLAAVVAAGAWWVLDTEAGLHWAAGELERAAGGRLELEGLSGALLRGVSAERIQYRDGGTDVQVRNASARLELLSLLGGRAGLRSFQADAVDIVLGASRGAPASPPSAPALPLGVRIERADIGRITLRHGEERHVVENVALRDAVLRQDGRLSAQLSLSYAHPDYPVEGAVKLGGSLEQLELAFEGRVAQVPTSGKARLAPFAAQSLRSVEVQAAGVDLARLNAAWPRTELGGLLSARAGQDGSLSGRVSAKNALPGPLNEERLPVTSLESRFHTDLKAVSLEELRVALGKGGVVQGSGRLTENGANFDVAVAALDLRTLRSDLRRTQLSGPLKVHLADRQRVEGTLSQQGMTISADLVREGDVIDIRSLRAEAEGGEATGSGRVRLGEPVRFEGRAKLSGFDPSRFGDYPQAAINGSFEGSGSLGQALRAEVRWRIADSRLQGEALTSNGSARISRDRLAALDADARFGAARVSARGDFGRPGDRLALELDLPRIEHFVDGVNGRLRAHASISGSLEKPEGNVSAEASNLRLPNGLAIKRATLQAKGSQGRHVAEIALQATDLDLDLQARLSGAWEANKGWSGEVQALRNAGRYPLQLTRPAHLEASRNHVALEALEAKLGEGRLLVKDFAWAPERLRSSGEFRGLPARWLLAAAGGPKQVRSTLLLDGRWALAASPRLTGTLSLSRAAGDLTLSDTALGLSRAAIDARFKDSHVTASGSFASRFGSGTIDAEVGPEPQGQGPGLGPASPLSFKARLALAELRALTKTALADGRIDGRISAELKGSGTLGNPAVTGSVEGEALSIDLPPYGIFLKDGRLRASLEGDSLRVEELSIRAGEGRLTASGALPLLPRKGSAELAWKAKDFGLLQRPDLRLVVSGAGDLRYQEGKLMLAGALRADRGQIELEQERLPKLGADVVVKGQERQVSAKGETRLPVALDLQVDLGDDLYVRGYGLEGKLTGQLQIETTKAGELRAYGRVRTVNATFLAYGQRLQVDPGVAIFDGPLDNPSLQFTAWRRNQQVEAGVQITGNARSPRVQLVSQPPVSEGERLSWLVLGRAPAEASKADLGLLQAAAGALLARGDQMPLDRRIARAFGLDEISLRGSGEIADRVVAIGKRLSDRLYVSYEQGLGAAASALVKLDYALTQRVSVRAETGTSSGLGLFYRYSWN